MEDNRVTHILFKTLCAIMIMYFCMAFILRLNDSNCSISLLQYGGTIVITLIALYGKPNVIISGGICLFTLVLMIYWYYQLISSWELCVPLQLDMCLPASQAIDLTITFGWILGLTIYGYKRARQIDYYSGQRWEQYILFI